MSPVTSRSWMMSAAVAVLIVLATTAGGETPQQPNQDTLGALLVEVGGLRSAIEQMASVGPSIQLAIAARRSRVPSRWDQAFWARFDAQRATLERPA
jgi:hypothetical protein